MLTYSKIKQLCKSNGITVTGLEKELGFARGSLCKVDTNKPSMEKVQKLADYFNMSVDSLTGDNSSETQERLFTKQEIVNLFAGRDSVIEDFFKDKQSDENKPLRVDDIFVGMCKELIQGNRIKDVIPMNSETSDERRKTRGALADWLKREGLLDGLYFDRSDYTREELSKINEFAKFLKTQREPLLNAAHQRTDIDIPEGADTSDNDIMDDENF
jgi:transcriptional regulator with XRE-family HTH domain